MRYYFDIADDFLAVSDSEGTEYASLEVATKEAIIAVTSIARDVFTSKGSQVTVTVRNEDRPLFEMTVRMARRQLD
ncbi:DUF6894 family protein [Bradyrhizobium betae]|uniref:DUF6894 domain-containing protein n=1 Tax=Bradyrhizobium betae TaxID=244734 RepID=A0A4Q1UPU4_9BRAD|nr:hypothetical protein [Bradyrhizobium betae]RXT36367.1 hypothetical protein B5V03_32345 [Bradyrhizobium betae]